MKTSMLYIAPLLLSLCLSCDSKRDSSKDRAEEENKEKFDNREEEKGDAKFVVKAMEQSYEVLQLAKLGETKAVNAKVKTQARKIIDGQQQIIANLESYAKSNDVSIPTSPEDNASGIKQLNDEESPEKFARKWSDEMMDYNKKMIKDFEDYKDDADGSLQSVVNSSLETLRSNHDLLEQYISENHIDDND